MKGILAILLAIVATAVTSAAQNEITYRIEPVKGNVYRFTSGHYHSIFMVTEDGIFLADPISRAAATWLKPQLQERFGKPLRYVAYSHNHYDHTDGGEVLAGPGVTFMSHRLAREDLVGTHAATRMPDIVFEKESTVYLGDSSVRMTYHGTNNGRGSVSMKFEPAGVMFVVDWIVLGRMPYKNLQGYDIHGMISSTRDIVNTDFDVIVCGHGNTGDKAAVKRYLSYLEQLYSAVAKGRREGRSAEQLKREIRLDEFKDLENYEEWLPLNIEGVSRTLDDQSYMDMRQKAQ